jgi:hypothetical protein
MKIDDDEFPYASDDPSLAPAEEKTRVVTPSSQPASDLKATLRLVIGSALNGRDAYVQRVRQLQSTQESAPLEVISVDADETPGEQLKYLLLGALFEIPELFDRGLSTAGHASSKVYGLVSKITSPLTNSWIFSPVKDRYEHAAARGEEAVERLMMRGRREELNSRRMVQRKALDDLVNDLLEYVVVKTDVQELIEEEGIGMATGMLDEYREQSADVDALLERRVKAIFRRGASSHPATPPDSSGQGK